MLVAEKGDEIVGMCSVQILISTAQGGPVGLLEDLIVRKGHRGNGIGTRLLSEIFIWYDAKYISRLQLLRDADSIITTSHRCLTTVIGVPAAPA